MRRDGAAVGPGVTLKSSREAWEAGRAGLSQPFCSTDTCQSKELRGNPQLLRGLHLRGPASLCVKHKWFEAGATLIDRHILTKALSVWPSRFLRNNQLAQNSTLHLILKMYFLACLVNQLPNNIKLKKKKGTMTAKIS